MYIKPENAIVPVPMSIIQALQARAQ